ncbi:hypothetical protein V6O07_05070, partial [Arthrospira platensis SPKY2]
MQVKAKIAEPDARSVYLCVARHAGGNGAAKRMTVREIGSVTRLTHGRIAECVRNCEFLTFVDDYGNQDGARDGDRVVQTLRLPVGAPEASESLEWVKKILRKGYSVEFVGYCESAQTPGFLGIIAGVTDHQARKVRIATFDKREDQIIDALA